MEPQQDPISTSTAPSEGSSQTASSMDEHERPIKREDEEGSRTPTYLPPGYPDLRGLWTQPPQQLPGPDDHPFFIWIAEGAKKDPAVIATNNPPPRSSDDRHDMQSTSPTQAVSSAQSVIQPQTVYPFVPAPTIAMEPITPDLRQQRSFPNPSPSHRTPDLSFSPTEPSPQSAHTATPASHPGKAPLNDDEEAKKPTSPRAEEGAPEAPAPAANEEEPECTSTYMRLMTTNPDTHRPLAVLNGQIWRSSADRRRTGWRRHQWSLDVG